MKPYILSGDVSGSMSSFKVKGQIYMQVKSPILTYGRPITFEPVEKETSYFACTYIS